MWSFAIFKCDYSSSAFNQSPDKYCPDTFFSDSISSFISWCMQQWQPPRSCVKFACFFPPPPPGCCTFPMHCEHMEPRWSADRTVSWPQVQVLVCCFVYHSTTCRSQRFSFLNRFNGIKGKEKCSCGCVTYRSFFFFFKKKVRNN